MLTSLRLINFKNHEDTLIEGLKPLSVFVGPNAVGKSSILEGAAAFYPLRIKEHHEVFTEGIFEAPDQLVRNGHSQLRIQANGQIPQGTWQVSMNGSVGAHGSFFGGSNGPFGESESKRPALLADDDPRYLDALRLSVYLRPEPSRLKWPSIPNSTRPELEPDGYGLATVVSRLMREDPDTHEKIVDSLHSIVPSVLRIRVTHVETLRTLKQTIRFNNQDVAFDSKEKVIADQLLFDTVDKRGVPASMQSDGTLYVLALLTAISIDDEPRLVLLDDVETGLHPKAQLELIPLLKKLVGDGSRVQLLMTTHSPYIVDGMEPDEVWVCGRDNNQRVRVKRLSDLPNVKQALGVLTTGELWGELGEDWVGDED